MSSANFAPSAPPAFNIAPSAPPPQAIPSVGGAAVGDTGSLIWFGLLTLLNIGILTALFTVGNLEEVGKNWPKYRCNPIYMPFASSFGHDPAENFNFCLDSVFAGKAAAIFAPLYNILSEFGTIISKIVNVAMGLRNLFANMLNSVQDFLGNVKQRILTILMQVRISFMKMNQLMGRVFGTMFAVINMGMSALTAGQNVANNDLVQFLFEFCFAPETPIELASGDIRTIQDIKIGDSLATVNGINPVVTSKFVFDGSRTSMVKIGDVHLSAEHLVDGAVAEDHPDAVAASSIPRLVCMNVSGHQFRVGGLIVSDYDESSDTTVIQTTQALAETKLNGTPPSLMTDSTVLSVLQEYTLGIEGDALVLLTDGTWKLLREIQIGDTVQTGGTVLGTVTESVVYGVTLPCGLVVSASQLLWTGNNWKRAAVAYPKSIQQIKKPLYQLFTTQCSSFHVKYNDVELCVREYREIADPAMEDSYREELAS